MKIFSKFEDNTDNIFVIFWDEAFFFIIESLVNHRDGPGEGDPPLATKVGIVGIYLKIRQFFFIFFKAWDLLTFSSYASLLVSNPFLI